MIYFHTAYQELICHVVSLVAVSERAPFKIMQAKFVFIFFTFSISNKENFLANSPSNLQGLGFIQLFVMVT